MLTAIWLKLISKAPLLRPDMSKNADDWAVVSVITAVNDN